jgi:hypothetical protein
MGRLQLGVVRYSSVSARIAKDLGLDSALDCRIGAGRITLTFRHLHASGWPEARKIEHALHAVGTARAVLANDPRAAVRERVTRAITVVIEDAAVLLGCAVLARWECVVPPTVPSEPFGNTRDRRHR